MTVNTVHYAELLEQGQDAVRTAIDTWTRTLTTAVGQLPALAPRIDAEAAVDRFFDLNEKLLAAQRDFAKQLVGHARTVTAESATV
jgi:hypothetical protein